MSSANKILIGILAIIVLLVAIYYSVTELVVRDVNKGVMEYTLEKDDAYGIYVFKELLESRADSVITINNIVDFDVYLDSCLIIQVDKRVNFEKEQIVKLEDIVYNDNNVMFFTEHYSFEYSDTLFINESLLGFQNGIISPNSKDTIRMEHYLADSVHETAVFEFDIYNTNFDTISSPKIVLDVVLNVDSIEEEIIRPVKIMQCAQGLRGRYCFHTFPYLVTNIAAKEAYFLEHYRAIVDSLDYNTLVWVTNKYNHDNHQGPLSELLKHEAFRFVVALILLSWLLFILFKAKRKLAAIPLKHVKENTTEEFIHNISALYQKYATDEEIIQLMHNNFYNFVRLKYGLNQNDEQMWTKLIALFKKEKEFILRLKNKMDSFKDYKKKNEYDVINLHHILTLFYKKAEGWKNLI